MPHTTRPAGSARPAGSPRPRRARARRRSAPGWASTSPSIGSRSRERLACGSHPRAGRRPRAVADRRARAHDRARARSGRRRPRERRAASTASRTEQSAPTITRSCSTERSTAESLPTEQCAPSTDCGPMCAPLVRQPSPISEPVSSRGGSVDSTAPGEQVVGGLEVALGRPDVDPVPGGGEAVEPAASTSAGNTSRSNDTARPGGIDSTTSRSSTYAPALIRLVGRRAVGLLEERLHAAVLGRGHHAVAGRVLHLDQRERGLRAGLLVPRELRGEVHVVEHVAVQHEQPVLQQPLVERQAHRARRCRAAPPRPRSAAACRRRCRRAPRARRRT